jgi:hypothetical protein
MVTTRAMATATAPTTRRRSRRDAKALASPQRSWRINAYGSTWRAAARSVTVPTVSQWCGFQTATREQEVDPVRVRPGSTRPPTPDHLVAQRDRRPVGGAVPRCGHGCSAVDAATVIDFMWTYLS